MRRSAASAWHSLIAMLLLFNECMWREEEGREEEGREEDIQIEKQRRYGEVFNAC